MYNKNLQEVVQNNNLQKKSCLKGQLQRIIRKDDL